MLRTVVIFCFVSSECVLSAGTRPAFLIFGSERAFAGSLACTQENLIKCETDNFAKSLLCEPECSVGSEKKGMQKSNGSTNGMLGFGRRARPPKLFSLQ